METFETEVNLERTREVMKSCIRAAPRPTIQAMSQRLKRRTHLRIVETRTIPDGFSCQGAGSKFQRKLEPVQIKTYARGAISRGLQIVRPDIMHLRLCLASLLNHKCISMRAQRAVRANQLVR